MLPSLPPPGCHQFRPSIYVAAKSCRPDRVNPVQHLSGDRSDRLSPITRSMLAALMAAQWGWDPGKQKTKSGLVTTTARGSVACRSAHRAIQTHLILRFSARTFPGLSSCSCGRYSAEIMESSVKDNHSLLHVRTGTIWCSLACLSSFKERSVV